MALKASLLSHLETLSNKHEELELSIHEAYTSFADDSLLKSLKKQKLAIKQQIAAIQRQLAQDVALDNVRQAA